MRFNSCYFFSLIRSSSCFAITLQSFSFFCSNETKLRTPREHGSFLILCTLIFSSYWYHGAFAILLFVGWFHPLLTTPVHRHTIQIQWERGKDKKKNTDKKYSMKTEKMRGQKSEFTGYMRGFPFYSHRRFLCALWCVCAYIRYYMASNIKVSLSNIKPP